ncbi:TPA: DUF192 domain-containing protein [archaeon]|uniref:DUF192 domain-containing protein n=1 Tax=Candidatus Naiadarchaeum limnaeum TaxID=2756139 RepID=A0A832UMV7_9ARCH|nr:DUF192 domain-containing protein [Candidatus Naiadarchaeales archaeon SRR2090153.bin1042]HIK00119.1 DUF192 domain-containing protein [Candidatus Naiadarchaeum limnaeum]
MKAKIFFVILAIAIFAAAFLILSQQKDVEQGNLLEIRLVNSEGKEIKIFAEIADNETELATGLSGRGKIPENRGMFFIFPEEGTLSFWMKDMKFPLDMIFFDSQFNIVDINENAQPCRTVIGCPIYPSKKPAKYVLEINAGLIRKYNIKIGDRAII